MTRVQAAKATINTFLNQITDCRLGLMVFNSNDNVAGGTILQNIGSSVGSIQSSVNGTRAHTFTPLGETMITALNFFSPTGSSAPIRAPCQKSFVVIVTDGLPRTTRCSRRTSATRTATATTSTTSRRACTTNDLRPDMDGIQNVATFTIGFNVDNGSLLQTAADNGGGEYYSISDAAGPRDGAHAVVQCDRRARRRRRRRVGGVVRRPLEQPPVPRALRVADVARLPRVVHASVPRGQHAGDAGALLPGSRREHARSTSINGTSLTAFTTTNASTLQSYLGAADLSTATNIITYVRGDSTPNSRSRNGWKLGDIVDAAPVMVGKPNSYYEIPGYATYRAARAEPSRVLYVAANDGMLHCFDISDGSELWAYIPKDQLPNLSRSWIRRTATTTSST